MCSNAPVFVPKCVNDGGPGLSNQLKEFMLENIVLDCLAKVDCLLPVKWIRKTAVDL